MSNNKKHDLLQTNLPYFARHTLKIIDKQSGQLIPFIFNYAQEYTHQQLEKQLKETGKVRALILKGRKQGESTYVGGRFYHKTTRNKGIVTFILSHEFQSAGVLFAMVDRFQKNCPEPVRASVGTDNSKQIKFDILDSEYAVGTAGNENIGRGGTPRLFHGSEAAFWEKTDGIETGIMQSVPDAPGTEIILESTANGMGNMFHQKCMAALKGEGEYILIFIPWFWQVEYRKTVPDDFIPTEEELKLKTAFKLDDEQLYWRRIKIEEFRSEWKFRQEYPMTVMDAFVTSGESLINQQSILDARKTKIIDNNAPLILGVDMGRTGDPVVIAPRRGRQLLKSTRIDPKSQGLIRQTYVSGVLANMIERQNVAKIFIDNGLGYGVIDNLVALGYGDIVQGVYFNEGALESDKFSNKRTEMHILARDWFHDGGVSIPDDEELAVIMGSIPDHDYTQNGLIKMKPKDQIKKDLGSLINLDEFDAFILTFAYPVAISHSNRQNRIKKIHGKSSLKTLKRVRNVATDTNIQSKLSIWGT
jgi:hypothetical protein